MDENERLIAQLMAEEANAIDAQNIAERPSELSNAGLGGGNFAEDGVRSPDQQRVQALVGNDADDMDEFGDTHGHQYYHQPRPTGGIASTFMNAASSVATGLNSVFGPPSQPN